jgi:hypothetical protein
MIGSRMRAVAQFERLSFSPRFSAVERPRLDLLSRFNGFSLQTVETVHRTTSSEPSPG